MPNIYASGPVTQPTSNAMLTTAFDTFTSGGVRQSTPQSATVVTTPPLFAGVSGVTADIDSGITFYWPNPTSQNNPHEFLLYIAIGENVPAATLFASNPAGFAPQGFNKWTIYRMADQSTFFVNGQKYTVGVRCRDGVNNMSTTLTTMNVTAIASGNLQTLFQVLHTQFSQDHSDFVQDHVNFVSDHQQFLSGLSDLQQNQNSASGNLDTIVYIGGQTSGINQQVQSIENSASGNLATIVSILSNLSGVTETSTLNLNTINNQIIAINSILSVLNSLTASVSAIDGSIANNLILSLDSLSGANLALAQSNINVSGTQDVLQTTTANLGTINSQISSINTIIGNLNILVNGVSGIEVNLADDLSVLISGLNTLSSDLVTTLSILEQSNFVLSQSNDALSMSNINLLETGTDVSGTQQLADTLLSSIVFVGGQIDSVSGISNTLLSATQAVAGQVKGSITKKSVVGVIEKP